jgi:glycosyltransferase involved in cell wall biosynthesis
MAATCTAPTWDPLSIVMFVKNGMPFVQDAVASLEVQTCGDYELVIQDAASTDGTTEFLLDLPLPRVRMVSESDAGLGDAYNRASFRCAGEIVSTLDADNLLLPNARSKPSTPCSASTGEHRQSMER